MDLLTGSPALASDDRRSGEGRRPSQVTTHAATVDVRPGDGTWADEDRRCWLRELGTGAHTLRPDRDGRGPRGER